MLMPSNCGIAARIPLARGMQLSPGFFARLSFASAGASVVYRSGNLVCRIRVSYRRCCSVRRRENSFGLWGLTRVPIGQGACDGHTPWYAYAYWNSAISDDEEH